MSAQKGEGGASSVEAGTGQHRMSEVSSRACVPVVDEVAAAGVAAAQLLRGLSFTVEDLNVGVRVTWDDFAVLLERATRVLGGLDQLTWSSRARPFESGVVRWLATQSASPRALFLSGSRWYAPSLVSNVRFRCSELPDGRLRQTVDILAPYRESPEFLGFIAGALRRIPRLVGLPDAQVEMEANGRRATYTVTLPRVRTSWLRRAPARSETEMDELMTETVRSLSLYETELQQVNGSAEQARHQLAVQTRQLEAFHQLGRQLGHRLDVEPLADQVCQLFVRCFDMAGITLRLARPPRGEFQLLSSTGDVQGEPAQRHVLRVADRVVGRLELWERLGGSAAESRDLLEQLLPWLALALDNACASRAIASQSRRLEAEATDRRRAESQLLQAQKMEAVGRLGRGMAHDFNNLLTTINGFADIAAQRAGVDSPARAAIDQVRIAGERGAKLVYQLLSFSRKRALRPERLELNQVIRQMEPMLTQMLGENMALKLDLEPNLARVVADPAQIEQVLVNLVENGRDAMHSRGTLTIGTAHASKDPSRQPQPVRTGTLLDAVGSVDVRLWVADDGRGMDAETRARIFEPFFTTKPHSQSSAGLGLSTVYAIVSQSGGTISVDSEVGNGTLVTIDLPCDDDPIEDEPPELAPIMGQTVLLVEDDIQVRALAAQILQERGFQVIEAADGLQALECIRDVADQIQVVVTDIVMPDMDGRELGGELLQHCPGLKGVVYVSGYQDMDLGVYGPLPRQAAFLRKPFTPARLLSAVQRALS